MNLKKRRYCFLVLSLLAGLGTGMGCSTESMPVSHDADSNAFSARTLPIFNGERVTGNNEHCIYPLKIVRAVIDI